MPNYLNIVASNCFKDGSGAPLQNGELRIRPSSPFQVGGGGSSPDQDSGDELVRTITAGSLDGTLQLANPAVTSPLNIGWTFKVKNLRTGHIDTYANVPLVDDGTGHWNFATLNTGLYVPNTPYTLVQGPQGPGGAASLTTSLTAAATISNAFAVAVVANQAVPADNATSAHNGAVLGVATAGAAAGTSVTVQFDGAITFSGWNWTLGQPVLLGRNGGLTQTPPTSGFLQVIGTPLSATSLLVNLQAPITLV